MSFVKGREPSILEAKAAMNSYVTIKGGEATMATDTDLFFFDCKVAEDNGESNVVYNRQLRCDAMKEIYWEIRLCHNIIVDVLANR
ncbi:hypothetical protein IEQ34_005723 [Dendrobium chrysotoxum]|uniref:Uncharacterized protein n=1 Tax=Dendrobium chrysotoxum TaxID=161865 RepID=A0AAV7HDS9_DENCH|nr:hypothetical protein IEQ34_005723 [Dendrobium chrysotoxum]